MLRRFGLPDHFVNVVIRLHEKAKIKVKVGEVESELESSIGVRQGSIMQAAMWTMKWPVPKPEFRTRANGVTMGEKSGRKSGAASFDFWLSLFADDCAIFFNSRADLITGSSYLYNHLRNSDCLCTLVMAPFRLRLKRCIPHPRGWSIQLRIPRVSTCVTQRSSGRLHRLHERIQVPGFNRSLLA